jgi:hypothetical protein
MPEQLKSQAMINKIAVKILIGTDGIGPEHAIGQ